MRGSLIRSVFGSLLGLLTLCGAAFALEAGPGAHGRTADQAALKPFGAVVGKWRGSGQPERGKTKGAWREQAEWVWKLTPQTAALEAKIASGKYLKDLELRPGSKPKSFVLKATLADGSTRTFQGTDEGKKALVLSADRPGNGVRRLTLTPLHDTRLLLKLEGQDPSNKVYYQLGEVGYTREGVAFASGETGPICIVTEGKGSMPVQYKGKTYHVCCSGCRDLFNEDPEAVIAEAAARDKAKSKK